MWWRFCRRRRASCMTVPISRVRRRLIQEEPDSDEGDLLGVMPDKDRDAGQKGSGRRVRPTLKYSGVLWRGSKDSKLIGSPSDLRPGDTLVIPKAEGGWDELGHIPCLIQKGHNKHDVAITDAEVTTCQWRRLDVAQVAFQAARDRATLRIHPSLLSGSAVSELLKRAAAQESPPTTSDWQDLLTAAHAAMPDDAGDAKATLSLLIGKGLVREPYPDKRGVVLTTRQRLESRDNWFLPSLDEGDDSSSRVRRRQPISLAAHTRHIVDWLGESLMPLSLAGVTAALHHAATLHDVGKADERFQAMLRREDRTGAWLRTGLNSGLIAKSDGVPQTRWQQRAACRRAGLPAGFRHEMLSFQLAQQAAGLPEDRLLRDLTLHLIAAHHGYARPFAPVVSDDDPPDVEVNGISIDSSERRAFPPHRLDSGIAERFWSLTRHFGWWGLAYLESLLRLADQQASAAEDSGELAEPSNEAIVETTA